MNKILHKALMRHHNDFFKLSEQEQEVFKLQEHDELDEKISKFVHNAINYDEDSEDPEKVLEYNKILLHYNGIGENYFMLNEFDWNEKILKHKNLYEYNEYYHNWQEEAFKEDENFPNYEPAELYNRFSSWARAEIHCDFFYINLCSIQMWVNWKLDEVSMDWIEEQIPHKYVSGPDDGKKTEGGYLWDQRIDANGLEGWYEQINDFNHEWIGNFFHEHEDKFDKVYIINTTENKNDPSMDYIIGSLNVLKKLTFRNFIEDCNKVHGDTKDIIKIKDESILKLKVALETELEKIKKTPPNVLKFRKKNKIVMAAGVLEELGNIEE